MDDIVQLRLNDPSSIEIERLTPSSLPMPRDRMNNFWYVKSESQTVIVFIHGIFSNSRDCWLYDEQESGDRVFWPDLVRDDFRFHSPSIFMAGFDTRISSGDFALADCSTQVFGALESQSIDGTAPVLTHKSIVFVCHSAGGIVARYLIERNKEIFRHKAVGLVLLASPSLGSGWANVFSILAQICNQRLGLQLRRGNETIDDLDGRFQDLVDRRAKLMPLLFGMEACEHNLVFRDSVLRWLMLLVPNRGKIVSRFSAGRYFGRVTEIPGTDHFSIVKPDSVDHPSHAFLVTFQHRFTEFLVENGYEQGESAHSDKGGRDRNGKASALAAEIRKSLISAGSIHDLHRCRASASSALKEYPEDADLILVMEQVEDALRRATELLVQSDTALKLRTRLKLAATGIAALALLVFVFFLGSRRPGVFITSVSKGDSVTGESKAIVSGKVEYASKNSSVYVLVRSSPEVWTASKAQVAPDGSWVADLGRWNEVTTEGDPDKAVLSAVVTSKPLEEQKVGTAGEGVFLIPNSRLGEIVGKQSRPVQIAVTPIFRGESLRVESPLSGSIFKGTDPFEARGTVSGIGSCVYLLHRTPEMGVWAAHPAAIDGEGHWMADLHTWNDHRWIHPGVNELLAISVRPDDCAYAYDLELSNEAVERLSLSRSPIVRVIVHK